MSNTVNSLFETAHQEGDLSAQSLQVLQFADIGQAIQGALGMSADEVTSASEVVLVSMMPDDSGSIRTAGNSQVVRDGHNLVLDSLGKSKQSDSILAHCCYLNGTVLYPYVPIAQAVRMDSKNYNPNLGTPLYPQSVVLLGTVLAKRQEFIDNGMVARTVSLIITDGADTSGQSPDDVRKLVTDLLRQEVHIVAGMGIDDGGKNCRYCGEDFGPHLAKAVNSKSKKLYALTECPRCQHPINRTDFYEVFTGIRSEEIQRAMDNGTFDQLQPRGGMGLLPQWVLTPGNSESDIRRAFQVFSQSAVRASQAAGAAFSQVAMGGFAG